MELNGKNGTEVNNLDHVDLLDSQNHYISPPELKRYILVSANWLTHVLAVNAHCHLRSKVTPSHRGEEQIAQSKPEQSPSLVLV